MYSDSPQAFLHFAGKLGVARLSARRPNPVGPAGNACRGTVFFFSHFLTSFQVGIFHSVLYLTQEISDALRIRAGATEGVT